MSKLTLEETVKRIEPKSTEWEEKAAKHVEALAMPPWALGDVCRLGVKIAGMQRTVDIDVSKKMIFTMAADHGVADEGVSAFPQEVTVEMMKNIALGGAGVNVLGRAAGVQVRLVDMAVKEDFPELAEKGVIIDQKITHCSENMRKGPAMTREQAIAAIEAGIDLADKAINEEGVKMLGTGELGIGNTTPASAVVAVMGGYPVADITGRGTGVDDEGLRNKIQVIQDAIDLNKPDPNDAIDVLSKVGGYDIAGIAGTILGAAANKTPVVVDGFISTAGALIAKGICPEAADYMIASHKSEEPGHALMWKTLDMKPLLDLGFRLGEGTGAAVAMHICECSARIMNDMLTFEEAEVTNANA